jgi:hypothetical protein
MNGWSDMGCLPSDIASIKFVIDEKYVGLKN